MFEYIVLGNATYPTNIGIMPQPTVIKKPLLLIFTVAQISNYKRCLIIANHLKDLFEIQFLHSDKLAPLVYQQGYDTFSKHTFSWPGEDSKIKSLESNDSNIELQFLDLVEILETIQPSLVINDGINTLSMAAEFTGIPMIAILNGYMSPYFANNKAAFQELRTNEAFITVREKYGLKEKYSFQNEIEGDLNWICDLSDFFPQRELPEHYISIGPIFELVKTEIFTKQEILNPLKKTVFLDLESIEQSNNPNEFISILDRHYNLIVNNSYKHPTLYTKTNFSNPYHAAQLLPDVDLVLTNSESTIYKALFYGIQVLIINPLQQNQFLINVLEDWNLGACWYQNSSFEKLEYRTSLKQSDTHRILKYKLNDSITMLGCKIRYSLSLHFPFLKKAALPII